MEILENAGQAGNKIMGSLKSIISDAEKVLENSTQHGSESYQNAMAGKFGFVKLDQRYGGVMSPDVQIVDVQACRRKGLLKGHITSILHDEIGRQLERGKQIILFVQNFLHHRISAVFPDILEVL